MATDWNNQEEVLKKRQMAIDAGYKSEDVDAFIKKKRDENAMIELAKRGMVNASDLASKDPQLALKIASNSNQPQTPVGADAVAEVMKQGGSKFIQQGRDIDARSAIAQEILKLGGVGKYREQLPLDELLTQQERDAQSGVNELRYKIDSSLPNFSKDEMGGTGPLAQFIPSIFRTPAGREKVANAADIQSKYAQLVSGKVISEPEMRRLEKFLPTPGKTETQNREDLQRLQRGIEANLQLFEKAKRNGLTPDEAYRKYGSEIIGTDGTKVNKKSGSKFTIEAVQ